MTIYYFGVGARQTLDGIGLNAVLSELQVANLGIEPVFAYELDLERDHGTYLNLELGHTFTLIDPSGTPGVDGIWE